MVWRLELDHVAKIVFSANSALQQALFPWRPLVLKCPHRRRNWHPRFSSILVFSKCCRSSIVHPTLFWGRWFRSVLTAATIEIPVFHRLLSSTSEAIQNIVKSQIRRLPRAFKILYTYVAKSVDFRGHLLLSEAVQNTAATSYEVHCFPRPFKKSV